MRDTRHDTDFEAILAYDPVRTRDGRERSGPGKTWFGQLKLNRSPLARKIIAFNLIGLLVLMGGVVYLNPFGESLAKQRVAGLRSEVALVANVLEAVMPRGAPVSLSGADGIDPQATLDKIDLPRGVEAFVFGIQSNLLATRLVTTRSEAHQDRSNVVVRSLDRLWTAATGLTSRGESAIAGADGETLARALIDEAIATGGATRVAADPNGETLLSVAVPIRQNERIVGTVAISSAAGEIDQLVRSEREQVLQVFVVAMLVSIGLSLALASTIATPLSELATAAEVGRDRHNRKVRPGRVRIPDLTARNDEIGRLSGSLRGMVAALYDRIEANEQFAADVAHEIKNPLASLRSAIGTMRVARRQDQQERLLDVVDHDVRRLDRLVSDISNASRLDSELVKEDESTFDLARTLSNLALFYGKGAEDEGVEFIVDLPDGPVCINGLEARLAQVFVNLITNAVSFCDEGDAVRLWARQRENRILVVVEDTGPGIPEQALCTIFNRFYSERPPGQFGNHSGLGLAISKQIVEAHGGVIWAENIRPTDADLTSEPLGARFVVGLPI